MLKAKSPVMDWKAVHIQELVVKIGGLSLGPQMKRQGTLTISIAVGSRGFMAPEVESGRYNSRVDVYSIGVTTFWLLCTRTPNEQEGRESCHCQSTRTSQSDYKFQLPSLAATQESWMTPWWLLDALRPPSNFCTRP